jgi:hypothetical protein
MPAKVDIELPSPVFRWTAEHPNDVAVVISYIRTSALQQRDPLFFCSKTRLYGARAKQTQPFSFSMQEGHTMEVDMFCLHPLLNT